jgi:methyl-accepting chemotaxis protein
MSINLIYNNVKELKDIQKSSKLLSSISKLIHETQKERGMTAGFLGSKGLKFKDKLFQQRELTNRRTKELHTFLLTIDTKELSNEIDVQLINILADLNNINQKRTMIDNFSIKLSDAIQYYTSINTQFLNIIIEVSKISESPQITRNIIAYSNFLNAKEKAGIERAVATTTLNFNKYKKGISYLHKIFIWILFLNMYQKILKLL